MSDRLLLHASSRQLPSRMRYVAADLARWISSIPRWAETCRLRRELVALDDHMLADIGLTRERVAKELDKWPWQ